jgi:hypothetical protein
VSRVRNKHEGGSKQNSARRYIPEDRTIRDTEILGSIKSQEYHDQLNDRQNLEKDWI